MESFIDLQIGSIMAVTKYEIKNKIKYIKYTSDLQRYTQRFFNKNYYGFPFELIKGFNDIIDYIYEHEIIQGFMTSKKEFRTFKFNNEFSNYQFISTPLVLYFYVILLKYKSKIFILLYDTEVHHLHFALPISHDY
jgi:hypothetical protein